MFEEEGYIQFECRWIKEHPLPFEVLADLNAWRSKLYQLNLVGMTSKGIGFGNLSQRFGTENQFIISGTQTGNLPLLKPEHYTTVRECSIDLNSVTCVGPIEASSESLTHAALYEASCEINAVLHVHHSGLWNTLKDKRVTSDESIEAGTPEMADEVLRLFEAGELTSGGLLVMGGHKDGLLAFGSNLDAAGQILLSAYEALESSP